METRNVEAPVSYAPTTAAPTRPSVPATPRVTPGRRPASPPENKARPARITARGVAEAVLLLVLFAVCAEIASRVEDRIRFGTPFLSRYRSQADLVVRDRDGAHGRPNARFQKWRLNNLGLRGPDVPVEKAPGTIRVVTLGASETFGLSETAGREYPRQLEDSLNARAVLACGADAHRFEVLNAALPGMTLPTGAQNVRTRLGQVGADFMVVYPTPVQYLDEMVPLAARPDSSGRNLSIPFSHALQPRFAGRMRTQLKELLPEFVKTQLRKREIANSLGTGGSAWRFAGLPADRMEAYDADLRALVGTIRQAGAAPLLVTHANALMQPGPDAIHLMTAWEKFYPRATGPIIAAFDSSARHVTLGVARDSATASVDLAGVLTAGTLKGVFSDFSHFTDHGSARMAATLAPAVIAAAGACRAAP